MLLTPFPDIDYSWVSYNSLYMDAAFHKETLILPFMPAARDAAFGFNSSLSLDEVNRPKVHICISDGVTGRIAVRIAAQ